MHIVFMGTPDFAVPTLDALVAAGHRVVAAYTQPPRPGGRRGRELVPSPVQRRAEALGIPVRTPARLKDAEEQAAFAALDADVGVVAAYGLILPPPVLDAPRHGCLNVHGSLLPRWRGAAPVQRAIMAGDAKTGVCIMQMAAGLDTGPVRLTAGTAVDGKTAGALSAELAALGARLMVEVLTDLASHPPVPQPEAGVTYAAKIDKAEARIDWSWPAVDVERLVRAMNPAPGAWFEAGGERVKVLAAEALSRSPQEIGTDRATGSARGDHISGADAPAPLAPAEAGVVLDDQLTIACGTGAVRPTLVQRAGGRPMAAAELLRGFPLPPGTRL